MVAYADLILPDTTYLERHDCISLLDRPISEPDAAGDAIRWPVVEPDRDVRGFQSVLLDLGARLGLPGMVDEAGAPKFRDYADYIVNHQRRPGVGPLIGWRGNGGCGGRGAPNPDQIDRYIANGGFFQAHVPEGPPISSPGTPPIRTGRWRWLLRQPAALSVPDLVRTDAPFPAGRRRPRPTSRPTCARRLKQAMDPLPIWYPPFGDAAAAEYPVHALTQRPMAMYHSWGSQNAWLRQIHGQNMLVRADEDLGGGRVCAGDWARVTSPMVRSRCRWRIWRR
jgi:sulfite dehydrogenase (quinone) subunit SoeA